MPVSSTVNAKFIDSNRSNYLMNEWIYELVNEPILYITWNMFSFEEDDIMTIDVYGHFCAHDRLNGRAERPPTAMEWSQRRNSLRLRPRGDSNSGGNDLWSFEELQEV